MTQEALKLALDALETELSIDWGNQDEFNASAEKMYKAIAAIKEALAQQEQLHASEDVSIGVDMTLDGAHVTALRSYRNGAKVVFYSQFHSAPQRTEQEPSGHFLDFAYSDSIAYVHVYDQFRKGQQFYKAPPQRTWAGLKDEDKHKIWYEMQNIMGWYSFQEIANAIEAKLKEKNT